MRILRSACQFSLAGVVALLLFGCGESMPPLFPVTGTVKLEGQPLKDAQISFIPDTEKGNKSPATAVGKVKDGTFTLTTKGKPGAPAGWYKVIVLTQYPGGPPDPESILPIYTNAAKSTLSVEVVPSPGADAYNLKVEKSHQN